MTNLLFIIALLHVFVIILTTSDLKFKDNWHTSSRRYLKRLMGILNEDYKLMSSGKATGYQIIS